MAGTEAVTETGTPSEAEAARIYEVGYHIAPTVQEGDVEKVIGMIRALIEKAGGSFIAEGAPSLVKLAYPMSVREGEKSIEYDRANFGWLKFESSPETARALEASLQADPQIIRCIVFKTIREDTRAKMKAPTLREIKRTDTIKAAPKKVVTDAEKAPVSEADLDKALETLTAGQ